MAEEHWHFQGHLCQFKADREIQCSQADSCVHEVCLQIMMVRSEVQEIRGWGKESGQLPTAEISGSCRGGRARSPCPALGLPGCARRIQVSTGHRSSMALAASTLLSCAAQSTALAEGQGDVTEGCAGTRSRCPARDGGRQ